jgi:hypothetical protein
MPGEGRVEVSLERSTNLLDAITSAPGDFQAWIAAPIAAEIFKRLRISEN